VNVRTCPIAVTLCSLRRAGRGGAGRGGVRDGREVAGWLAGWLAGGHGSQRVGPRRAGSGRWGRPWRGGPPCPWPSRAQAQARAQVVSVCNRLETSPLTTSMSEKYSLLLSHYPCLTRPLILGHVAPSHLSMSEKHSLARTHPPMLGRLISPFAPVHVREALVGSHPPTLVGQADIPPRTSSCPRSTRWPSPAAQTGAGVRLSRRSRRGRRRPPAQT
jgi:hypothetical protein